MHATVSVAVDDIDQAVAAVRGGAGDLLIGAWTTRRSVRCERRWPPRGWWNASPCTLFCEIDEVRATLEKPAFTAGATRFDGFRRGPSALRLAPGRDIPSLHRVPAAGWSAELGRPRMARGHAGHRPGGCTRRLPGSWSAPGRHPPTRAEVETLFAARGAEVEAHRPRGRHPALSARAATRSPTW